MNQKTLFSSLTEVDYETKYPKITAPPVDKPTYGYLYIAMHTKYPDVFKLGFTQDVAYRYSCYNKHLPVPDVNFHLISSLIHDAKDMEALILQYLYKKTPPIGLRKEWFEIQHMDLAIELIHQVEKEKYVEIL